MNRSPIAVLKTQDELEGVLFERSRKLLNLKPLAQWFDSFLLVAVRQKLAAWSMDRT